MIPTIILVIGMVVASFVHQTACVLAVFVACVVLVWLLSRWEFLQSIGVLLCVFLFGVLIGQPNRQMVVNNNVVEAVVFSEPSEKNKTIAMDLLLPDEGRQVRCYLWKDERSKQIVLGHSLLVKGADRGFVRSTDWQFGGHGFSKLSRSERLRMWFLELRHQLLNRYKSLQADDDQYAVLAAMTLGDKSALNKELREVYSVTGA